MAPRAESKARLGGKVANGRLFLIIRCKTNTIDESLEQTSVLTCQSEAGGTPTEKNSQSSAADIIINHAKIWTYHRTYVLLNTFAPAVTREGLSTRLYVPFKEKKIKKQRKNKIFKIIIVKRKSHEENQQEIKCRLSISLKIWLTDCSSFLTASSTRFE